MSEDVKEILDHAINEEEFFAEFYSDAAKKTDVLSVKEMLLKLSSQEKLHKEKLQTLDVSSFDGVEIPPMNNAMDLQLTPVSEFADLKAIFEYAIKFEESAKLMYEDLADSVEDEESKSLLQFLANEERKHKELLEEELEQMEL